MYVVTRVCASDSLSVCMSVCLSAAAFPPYCTDPDVIWENGRGCHVLVHCWADLQLVHGLHCYNNIAPQVLAVGARQHSSECEMSVSTRKVSTCLYSLYIYAWLSVVKLSVYTRAVQPVATCRQSPYLHKSAIVIVTSFSL